MMLSKEQQSAVDAFFVWYNTPCRLGIFRIFGYAGTGKTTIIRHILEKLGGHVMAYTGKAVHVLKQKGIVGATTIHQATYKVTMSPKAVIDALDEENKRLQALMGSAPTRTIEQQLMRNRKQLKAATTPVFSLNAAGVLAKTPLIIIDECSMIDKKLFRDISAFGKPMLLLGDPAQLPPVTQ